MPARPVGHLPSRAETAARYLRLAGLDGLVDPADPTVGAGVVQTPDGWRVAQDPATFGVRVPAMTDLLADAVCPVVLARGEPVTLPGLGHNAHVEDPAAVVELVRQFA